MRLTALLAVFFETNGYNDDASSRCAARSSARRSGCTRIRTTAGVGPGGSQPGCALRRQPGTHRDARRRPEQQRGRAHVQLPRRLRDVPLPRFDTAEFAPCASGTEYSLADGSHTFRVVAVDPSSNVGLEQTATWEIDAAPPAVTLTGGPAEGSATTARNAAFDVVASADAKSTACRLNGAPCRCRSCSPASPTAPTRSW